MRTNEEWVKGILQWKNTPHKSTGLPPAIMLYGHPVQDAIPCHKSSLPRNWYDDKLRIDREAARRKEKLEKYYNRGAKPLTRLKVGDPVCVQNINTKRWERYGQVMKCHQAQRRYLIKLESGLIIRRNRIHLRKRLTLCATEHHNRSFSGTGPDNEKDGPRRTQQAFGQGHDEQADASPRRSRRMSRRPSRFNDFVME